jgi:hypothetical protein
VIAR